MKKMLACLCALVLLLSACGGGAPAAEDNSLHVLATTYPVYLLTTAVTEGAEDVEVSLLVNQATSCLHDYTLTVNDMKAIEAADIIIMNGGGLESFMSDALAASDAPVVECAAAVELLEQCGQDGDHGHEGHSHEHDPHIWMDPVNAAAMAECLGAELAALDSGNAERYQTQAADTARQLLDAGEQWSQTLSGLKNRQLITFHDGFQYFAARFDLELLKSIEEEEGSEASASEIKEIVSLVEQYRIPAIFTETNGSDATARTIARECGCAVYTLDMLMSGEGTGLQPYLTAMERNIDTIVEALG